MTGALQFSVIFFSMIKILRSKEILENKKIISVHTPLHETYETIMGLHSPLWPMEITLMALWCNLSATQRART